MRLGVCSLKREIGSLGMEPGDYPKKFTLKMSRTLVKTKKRTGLDVKKDQIIVNIIRGMSHEYEIVRRILDCEANLAKQKIELVTGQSFERLQG